jgi:glycosyltransferase involved in cell wall biosynthesis
MIDVILPVLNEVQAIPWVFDRFPQGFSPLVVDNESDDGSAATAERLGARVVTEPLRGFGAACFAGLTAASTEVVCFMDCDGSLDPIDLVRIAAPVLEGKADLAIGRRSATRGAWPLHARAANLLLARRIQSITGRRVTDIGPMRAARRQALLDLELADRRFGWPLEMYMKAVAANWRIVEISVSYRARTGRSKVTGTLTGTLQTVADMARYAR